MTDDQRADTHTAIDFILHPRAQIRPKQIINRRVIANVTGLFLSPGSRDMSESSISKPARPWRVVAEEASHEFDPKKMADLMQELNQALQQQGVTGSALPGPQKKSA